MRFFLVTMSFLIGLVFASADAAHFIYVCRADSWGNGTLMVKVIHVTNEGVTTISDFKQVDSYASMSICKAESDRLNAK